MERLKHSCSAGSIFLGGTPNELEKSVSNWVMNQSAMAHLEILKEAPTAVLYLVILPYG